MFIDTCLKLCKLNPCHYFSSPRLSWDAMLKITGVKLENVSDFDMYLFIEKGLRGGISYIAKRYSEANNKCMENYDPTKPSEFIEYLDKNDFYGCAMSGYLSKPKGAICLIFKIKQKVSNELNLIFRCFFILKEKYQMN